MMNNKIIPAHILRGYIWELLRLNTDIQTINGRVPIIPLEDEPLLADTGKTYMIYGYTENNPETGGFYEVRRGVFALRIIGHGGFGKVGEIATVVSRAMEQGDISAEHVNRWSTAQVINGGTPFVGIRFTTINVTYVEGGEAAETEGGPVVGWINIAYHYITHQTVEQPVPGGLWS